jgi:hypothetical protein
MKAIIVGNANSLLQSCNGNLIDSFDLVIRLNKFQIKGYEQYVGTKTDIYCSKWLNMKYNINTVSAYAKIWLPYPKPPNWWTSKGNFKEVTEAQHNSHLLEHGLTADKITYLDLDRAEEMESIFKNVCQPSTGLISIMMAIQELYNYEIVYTGFDNFSTGWYWDSSHDCLRNMQNSVVFEKIFLNYVRSKYNVTPLKQ